MSNSRVYEVQFDDVKLEYVKKAGSGAPLFVVGALSKALGINDRSGYWYTPKIKQYITKRPLNQFSRRVISLDGVFAIVRQRKPLWEQDFRDCFVTDTVKRVSQVSQVSQIVIPPDNLELDEKKKRVVKSLVDGMTGITHRQDSMESKLDKLIEMVDSPPRAALYRPLYVPVYGTDKLVPIPSQAEHLFINMCNSRQWKSTPRALNGAPLYTHVEGYRTYKEMLAAVGMDILINTRKGRDLSRRMATLASKHGIKYYLVVDSVRYHQQHQKNQRRRVHMGTYSINAYPKEFWEVVEPIALKYLDEMTHS